MASPGTQQQFRVLNTSVVTPDDGPPAAVSVPLTFFDVKWLHLPPVQRVLLYCVDVDDATVDTIVSGLKDSLSRALRTFYPLAGRVRLAPGRADRHELLYRPGDGVSFTVAEYDADVDDLASDGPFPVSALSQLVSPLPAGRAVLAVQATVLRRGRGGVALGVTVHHTACDGPGSTHFLHAWASAARGKAEEVDLPVVDRTLVPDPRGLYDTYLKDMPPFVRSPDLEFARGQQDAPADVSVATFTLSEDALQSIKSAVESEAARRGRALPRRCSSLVAAYSLMWWCHCHASTSDDDDDRKSHSYFLFSVDQRARMRPAVPSRYLGNCMCPAIAKAPRDELLAADTAAAGVYAACAAVAAAIQEEVGEGAQQERWDGCVARVKDAVAHGLLSVAGSPRFLVYDLDFGFGRPTKVHILSAVKAGAVSVADARAGGRGIELGVALPQDAMDRFRKCFKDAIDSLRN